MGAGAASGNQPRRAPGLDVSGVEFTIDVREGTGAITVTGTAPRERMGDIVRIPRSRSTPFANAQP